MASVPKHYVTKQAILEEAGFSQPQLSEVLSGVADGANKVFSTIHKPLADTNYDDVVDTYDVTLYVNGTPVSIANVDADNGIITAAAAPASNATVTADYRYSPVLDAYVEQVREEAEDYIANNMAPVDALPYTKIPPTIRKIARVYAAGMLLAKEYGFNRDAEGMPKDGQARIKQAEAWLDAYIATGGSTGISDVSAAAVTVTSDAGLFSEYDQTTGTYSSPDELFMRDLGND